MEPVWGSRDIDGNSLMVPIQDGWPTTSVNPQQQPLSRNETLVYEPANLYSESSASYELLATVGSSDSDPNSNVHDGHSVTNTVDEDTSVNCSSFLAGFDNPEALNTAWESLGNIRTYPSPYAITDASSQTDSFFIDEEQFGDPAQFSNMNQDSGSVEDFHNQPDWEYWPEISDPYESPFQGDSFRASGAASSASSLSEYSDASSYYSQASCQSLSQSVVFPEETETGPPSRVKSEFNEMMFKSIDQKSPDCTVRGKRLSRLSSLQVHSSGHLSDKPFRCIAESGDKQFSVTSNLARRRKLRKSAPLAVRESGNQLASSISISSASSSVNSFHSSYAKNSLHSFFSRRSSTEMGDNLGDDYPCTSSFSTEASAPPGRRGPLGEASRAALRAVRSIGACWRCKVLRKKCDVEKPCKACPKKKGSHWQDIGCRRGAIGSESKPIILCPQAVRNPSLPVLDLSPPNAIELFNDILRQNMEERERVVGMLERLIEIRATGDISRFKERCEIEDALKTTTDMRDLAVLPILEMTPHLRHSGKDIIACVLAIIWEDTEGYQKPPFEPESLMALLTSATSYQLTSPGDRLIAQALKCLRACLEARRAQNCGYLVNYHHEACGPHHCLMSPASINLSFHLKQYLGLFSRVLFRKENLQHDRRWWLSAFYSLCIQGYVRMALLVLVGGLSHECGGAEVHAPTDYLHLAVKLFLASSAGYDPIACDYPDEAVSSEAVEHFKLAQATVGQPTWAGACSRDYLFGLFEIQGTGAKQEI